MLSNNNLTINLNIHSIFKYMEIAEEIKNIRKDLDTLVQLFSKLINKIVPEEKAEKEDEKAIKDDDEIVDEKEIFRVLEWVLK